MPKKVLMIVSSLGVGGMEKFALQLFKGIQSSAIRMDFLIFDNSRLEYLDDVKKLGAQVHIFDKSTNVGFLDEILFVNKILKNGEYDVIYVNSCSLKGFLTSIFPARRNKIKIIAHAHSVGYKSSNKIEAFVRSLMISYISRSIDFGYACSIEAAHSKYSKSFVESEKYRTINNAVNINNYIFDLEIRTRLRKQLNIDDKIVIGIVGRLEYEKNHLFLLDVLKKIVDENPKYVLLIIGGGSLNGKLQNMVRERNLENNVFFLGTRKDANSWYSAMDAFVLPSFYEGFPYVLVEAQLNGLKCFVSNTITNTVNISNTVCFLSIDKTDSVDKWKKEILDNKIKRIPEANIQKIKDNYDIQNEISVIVKDIMAI